jgi:hypothetical protein
MDIEIIAKIESNGDFKILIDEVILKTKSDIRKNIFDSSVLNNDREQMVSYYENERQKILKKFKKGSYSFRVEFDKDSIKINIEDYEQLFIYPTYIYDYLEQIKWNKEFHLEQTIKEKKDLFKFHKLRLKDIKNNIWLSYFNLNIKELKGVSIVGNQINTFNDLVFNNEISETFFNYMVENWLKEEPNKVTALQFVFSEMWYKTLEKETPYKIISTQPYFAREYWNKNYSNLLELHPKNPKLKKDNFIDYYHKRFKYFLTEFQGG